MKEFTALCGAGGLVSGVAVLALSVAAKLVDRETTRVVWPVTGGLRRLAGPAQATAAEALVAVTALLPTPAGLRLGLLGAVFTTYTIAALLMRGRRCGCFGSWIPARFTTAHAAGCAVVAALALTGVLGPPGVRLACAEAGAGLALAVVAAAWLRHRSRAAGHVEPPADVRRIVIFTTESCRYCAALEAQRDRYQAMADCPVEFRRADTDEEVRAAGGAFPAAVAYGADGTAVADAAHGLAAIRDLLRHSAARSGRPGSQVTT
ncbi:hypothetical protein NE235_18240 [Actinoallomurus spadix]|uniref:Methylamine utilization protein MauE n=1 Tax=Actinoallomurus spadix TaxID=79912 RepID=A0ABP3FLH1_9ACTN|nr:hypothetical protein [Actinoallomurus spadix]MCO5988045.1 hypothetical protein [Actinoallomurus spadix]